MKKMFFSLIVALGLATQVYAQQQPTTTTASPMVEPPQIIAFDNEGLLGDHIHVFGNVVDLGKWGNSISSMVILSGRWEFFDDEDFKGTKMGELGPGTYVNIADKGLKNNSISSIRLASPMPK